jgi:hypothetical protein
VEQADMYLRWMVSRVMSRVQASGIFTGVAAGLYTITVTDVNTCTRQSLPVILSDPLPLFEGIIGLDKSICLGADPTAFTELAPAFGGIGNYAYQWRESTDGVLFTVMCWARLIAQRLIHRL